MKRMITKIGAFMMAIAMMSGMAMPVCAATPVSTLINGTQNTAYNPNGKKFEVTPAYSLGANNTISGVKFPKANYTSNTDSNIIEKLEWTNEEKGSFALLFSN